MNTVCVVLKNADFTEGRGPMVFHKVFETKKKAIEWVSKQPGIFGSEQTTKPYIFGHIYSYNGYDVIPNVKVE